MTIATLAPASDADVVSRPLSARQAATRALYERLAPDMDRWELRNRAFHEADRAFLRFLVPVGSSVLEVGCGNGGVLAALEPARGVGIDLSSTLIAQARERHPALEFHVGNAEDDADLAAIDGHFDIILLSDTIGLLDDCEETLRLLHRFATPQTRIVISYHSRAWEPALDVAERLGLKRPQAEDNWLSTADTMSLLELAGWEPIKREWRQLVPRSLFGLGTAINRWIAPLPGIRRLCLRNYVVARPQPRMAERESLPSVTVLVPCRNERGNIENAVLRLPRFAPDMEVIYCEGHSRDNTYEECLRVQAAHPDWDIKVMRQPGKGKGDAVRAGFAAARGDILMILDADLTVPPETLGKFYRAMADGRGEFVNGTRLVYPMEDQAMRFLNFLANRAFARIFSFLLNQRFTDTLCGTKVLWRRDYEKVVANRRYFGDFDPFGDFDLIFGAAKLNLKIVEVPVRYADRTYGTTQISRFRHGVLLLRMIVFAWRKLKAF
ncbi:bifunctional class I SAM-dependent methyltransferase/glycosyltransferase family 2 protein [Azospirillum agricola]|uniref:bifunctional class I SAM-dependent methyltransferase/glycosyltransferase family 2 protein n=1 Tax=Azospirillum agricola TaxID=1720247 RepID=UPI000A0F2538|nr:bifunctional class I SAM-dependent methyltransferase/glycosyltransferase family 2 protein [Azospirillum agricola]SMH41349.1 Methyltransferase domain-containing protein [Azospirillum lipoferum]